MPLDVPNPVVPTIQFNDLAEGPESPFSICCTIWCTPGQKLARDGVQGCALGFYQDAAVMLEHVPADVSRDRHDGHIACLRLSQLSNAGHPQIVKPAIEPRTL
jgi:hypothetical protein